MSPVANEQPQLLAGVNPAQLTAALWDALRQEACTTGLKAQRIVMLNRDDVARAVTRLTAPPL